MSSEFSFLHSPAHSIRYRPVENAEPPTTNYDGVPWLNREQPDYRDNPWYESAPLAPPSANLEEQYAHQLSPNTSHPDQHLPLSPRPGPSHVGHNIPLAHDIPNNGARDRPPPMPHVVDPLPRSVYESVPSAAESLKRLADRYLHDPGSQVDALRVGLGPSGGRRLRVIIVLDIDI